MIPPQVGLAARFDKPAVQLVQVGPATFLLLVNNLGNLEDAYKATIAGITGPITASLLDLNGRPSKEVPLFRLPGLATGAILLKTRLTAPKQGKVTVQVRSLKNQQLVATATATVTTKVKRRGRRLGPG